MDNLIDINTLGDRYHLKSRQSVYDRLKDLGIKPARRGKITEGDLALLDELDKHINSGGTIDDFAKSPEVLPTEIERWEEPEQPTVEVLIGLIERLVLRQLPPVSPLAQYEELEKIAAAGWIVPTSTVKAITSLTPSGNAGVSPKGDRFTRGSFTFIRSGKVGREAGWKVQKSTL